MLAFVDRSPTDNELERLRLILSTYQDGTGMLADTNNLGFTLPGWRDFERSVALAFGGVAQESKAIFDVLLSDGYPHQKYYGISCKMRGELNRIDRDGRVTIELSNSAGKFWDYLYKKNIYQSNYRDNPSVVGSSILELIEQWHHNFSDEMGIDIDLNKSFYLALSWSKQGWYQLHQFSLQFPQSDSLRWYCPVKKDNEVSRRIIADDGAGNVFEWCGESGGQLKYYPLATNAIWESRCFQLEPLGDIEHGILAKVAAYFPELWNKAM